jgi:hypothetical protein
MKGRGMVQDDLLVVGFDLETRREVHIAEGPPERWKRLGYGGTGQLVCFLLFPRLSRPPWAPGCRW